VGKLIKVKVLFHGLGGHLKEIYGNDLSADDGHYSKQSE